MGEGARKANEQKSTVTPRVGRYVGNDGMSALVDLGGQRISAPFATAHVPQIGEPVWVDSIDGMLRMTGPTQPKPGIGVVLTINGTQGVIRTDFGDFSMTVAPTDPMPTSGDTVGISWSTQPWCTLIVDMPDPPLPPPPPSSGGGEVKTAEFRAVDAGSTDRNRARWWTPRAMASENTIGAFFYGNQIKDTIPAEADFVSLEVFVTWGKRRFGPPRWVLHDQARKDALPALSAFTAWEPGSESGWRTPPDPTAWFDGLKAGGAWWGVGFNQGGWEEAKSLAEDGMSGALRIKWR